MIKQRQNFWESTNEGDNTESKDDSSDDGIVWEDYDSEYGEDDSEADDPSETIDKDTFQNQSEIKEHPLNEGDNTESKDDSSDEASTWEDCDDADEESEAEQPNTKEDADHVNVTDTSTLIELTTATKRKKPSGDSKEALPFKRIKQENETSEQDTFQNQSVTKEPALVVKDEELECESSVSSVGESSSNESSSEESNSIGEEESDDSDDEEVSDIGSFDLSKFQAHEPPPSQKKKQFRRERDEDSSDSE